MKALKLIETNFREEEVPLLYNQIINGEQHTYFNPEFTVEIDKSWDFFTDTKRLVVAEGIVPKNLVFLNLTGYNVAEGWIKFSSYSRLKSAHINNVKIYLVE